MIDPAPPVTDRPEASPLRGVALRALAFLLLFSLMQSGWEAAHGTWIERLWVHDPLDVVRARADCRRASPPDWRTLAG